MVQTSKQLLLNESRQLQRSYVKAICNAKRHTSECYKAFMVGYYKEQWSKERKVYKSALSITK
tara:strand:+ start:83954 stop:84142 length:189 start_codon:yes stop_codon:yes gene_type:complete